MRLTLLSILATCLFPCLVDSTYGQGGEQHKIYDPGQALWNRIAYESHGNDYKTNTTHVHDYGTISMTFMVEDLGSFDPTIKPVRVDITKSGGAKPDGAVELYDRAAAGGRNQTIYYFAKPKEGKKGLNAVNVKVVMTGPGGPLLQDVTILPEKLVQTASPGNSGAVDHNTTRSNMGVSGGGDDEGQLKHGNDKVVRKKPGWAGGGDDGQEKIGNDKRVRKKPNRTTYAHITLSSLTDGTDLASWDNGVEKGMVDLTNGSSVTLFDMDGEVAAATAIEYGLIAALLRMPQTLDLPGGDFREGLEDSLTAVSDRDAIEYGLIAALLRSSGSEGDLHVWHDGNQTTMMNLETGSAVVVEQHVIRDPG